MLYLVNGQEHQDSHKTEKPKNRKNTKHKTRRGGISKQKKLAVAEPPLRPLFLPSPVAKRGATHPDPVCLYYSCAVVTSKPPRYTGLSETRANPPHPTVNIMQTSCYPCYRIMPFSAMTQKYADFSFSRNTIKAYAFHGTRRFHERNHASFTSSGHTKHL